MTRIKFLIYSLAMATLLVACGRGNVESEQKVSDEFLQNELNEILFTGITEMDSLSANPISASYDVEESQSVDLIRREIVRKFIFEELPKLTPSDYNISDGFLSFSLKDDKVSKQISIPSARIIITDKINPKVREVALLLAPDLIKHFDADLRSSLALRVEATFKNGRKEIADIPFPETADASDFENQIADFLVRCLDSSDSKKFCSITVVLS